MNQVLFLTSYPTPYKTEFFDLLGADVDITVLYFDRKEEQTHRSVEWFVEDTGAFRSVQLSHSLRLPRGHHVCTDVIHWLRMPWKKIVVGGYSSPTVMFAIVYMKLHTIPFCMEVDGGLVRQESKLKYLYKKMLVSTASYWLSSGKATSRYLIHYGAKPEKIVEYPFSSLHQEDVLENAPSAEEKAGLRKALGMSEEKIALYVGRNDPKKGVEDLLHAAKLVPGTIGIYFVGGEPTRTQQEYCRDNGLSNVHFVGFRKKEALIEYYKAADVLVLPTWSDVWGLVVNEAMACGLPVITTDKCVAGLELVENGVTGQLIPARNPELLAQAVCRILDGDYKGMGANALERIRGYTIEKMATAHKEFFLTERRG